MEFVIGQSAEFSKTVSESDVYQFAGICGDFNPVHINEVYAQNSVFQKRIVHGALINAFVSTVLGMYLPGEGTIYLSQESHFKKPVYIGDTVTARVEITDINEKRRAHLRTTVKNQADELVLEGVAYVSLPTA
ncbi:MAG: MaoC family dehydratase [Bacteroidales bacterium]|nr:MaoC family dehydratase [Lachnoclostridium sp.]MCM1385191.1 MaoC family dehydratase [Lachnoclostridium sp.]MCM1466012.1 MaoC family dehydratase [Bacteroidales bacterium]